MFTVHSTCFKCLLYLYVVNFVLSTLHLLLATASRLDYAAAAYTRQGTRIQINKHPSKLLISLSRPCWYIFWRRQYCLNFQGSRPTSTQGPRLQITDTEPPALSSSGMLRNALYARQKTLWSEKQWQRRRFSDDGRGATEREVRLGRDWRLYKWESPISTIAPLNLSEIGEIAPVKPLCDII